MDWDEAVCYRAGENCDGLLRYGPDPYASEIHGDETEMWLCEYHYYESCDEI